MSSYRQPLSRPPPRKDSLPSSKPASILKRSTSEDSLDSSTDSGSTTRSPSRPAHSPYNGQNEAAAASTSTIATSMSRPPRKVSYDLPRRQQSPMISQPGNAGRHRRQHSQGFFEPTLPTASYTNSPIISNNLTASTIAAQAAMHVQNGLHARRHSQNIPESINTNQAGARRKPSGPVATPLSAGSNSSSRASSQTRSVFQAGSQSSTVATTAANVVFPRSPIHSPIPPQGEFVHSPTSFEKDPKPAKERSRMKIFSMPKSINTLSSKDPDKKTTISASPKKTSIYPSQTFPRSGNQSMVSLADSTTSGAPSLYSTNSASTTLVSSERGAGVEKEKSRHNFLSRQRNKLKEGQDLYSSASSNSRPTDPSAPAPLYSFAPSSPGPIATFSKSKTGLDLRHAGRALREKKREEKAAAGTFVPPLAVAATAASERDHLPNADFGLFSTSHISGPASANAAQNAELAAGLGVFGLPGMTFDDAWPLLKARLLNIFEGEDIRTPIEDFNKLVLAHLQRCVNQQMPNLIIEDLRELLETGFYSIDQILRRIPDDRLVSNLVETWSSLFGTILPFMQAVFHPLDLEFKGRGAILSPKDARDFWGGLPLGATTRLPPPRTTVTSTHRGTMRLASLGDVLDVRTFVLLTFRDTVILPRYDTLLSIFSRLSLDSINATPLEPPRSPPLFRPGTAASSSSGAGYSDPVPASFNSQGSTLLDSSTAGSLGARSRATSNVSAMSTGSFHSVASQRPHAGSNGSSNAVPSLRSTGPFFRLPTTASIVPMDSSKATQTAALMLQCVSVLAGLQSASSLTADNETIRGNSDEEQDAEIVARTKMENLGKALKLNWLGRSRTGRNRKGLVGTKTAPVVDVGA